MAASLAALEVVDLQGMDGPAVHLSLVGDIFFLFFKEQIQLLNPKKWDPGMMSS